MAEFRDLAMGNVPVRVYKPQQYDFPRATLYIYEGLHIDPDLSVSKEIGVHKVTIEPVVEGGFSIRSQAEWDLFFEAVTQLNDKVNNIGWLSESE